MKPASIIFLVFALVLFIFGSILCSSAISKAHRTALVSLSMTIIVFSANFKSLVASASIVMGFASFRMESPRTTFWVLKSEDHRKLVAIFLATAISLEGLTLILLIILCWKTNQVAKV